MHDPSGTSSFAMGAPPPADAASDAAATPFLVRRDLAAAYRLIARQGWDDLIYSHVTAMVPGEPGRFFINAFGLAFDEIGPETLVTVDLDGNVLDPPPARAINRAGFALHAAVHRARPDAACVMHLHASSAIAVSTHPRGLLPLSQHAMRFQGAIAYHPYEGVALTTGEAARLVQCLGNRPAALLRNHGSLVLGRTVAEAYTLSVTLLKACDIQIRALAGNPQPVMPSPAVVERAAAQLFDNGALEGIWEWPALLRSLSDAPKPDRKP